MFRMSDCSFSGAIRVQYSSGEISPGSVMQYNIRRLVSRLPPGKVSVTKKRQSAGGVRGSGRYRSVDAITVAN